MITTRQKLLNCYRFHNTCPPPMMEIGIWGQTYDRWFEEGLPKDADWDINHFKASKHFGLEGWVQCPVNMVTYPAFERKILLTDDRTFTYVDPDGATRQGLTEGRGKAWDTASCMDHFIAFPVNDRKDFQVIKRRFDPSDFARYPGNWNALLGEYRRRDYPLVLGPNRGFGLYSGLRRWLGTENACTVFYDDPAFAEEMLDFLTDFFVELTRRVASDITLDVLCYFEDFAFKTGPLVSPVIFKKFLLPRYRRMNDHLRSLGVDIIAVDSDGNIEVLLPMLIKAGFNLILPMEQAAGMDAVKIRKEYGNALGMLGSIDKRQLAKGRKEIECELSRQAPYLLETGGYIPTVDHTVPPDISYDNFMYYLDLKRKLLEGRQVVQVACSN